MSARIFWRKASQTRIMQGPVTRFILIAAADDGQIRPSPCVYVAIVGVRQWLCLRNGINASTVQWLVTEWKEGGGRGGASPNLGPWVATKRDVIMAQQHLKRPTSASPNLVAELLILGHSSISMPFSLGTGCRILADGFMDCETAV